MTVAKLIEKLQKLDPKAKVLVSRDAEGNGFSELEDIGTGVWRGGDFISHPDDVGKKKPNAVCLWP